ncbi:MAG: bifunctional alpha/beta hydrolase/OsmC family protein [Marinosulfonomonas sp.]
MPRQTEKFTFPSASGVPLSARLDLPTGPARAYALFAHCFTCSKELLASRRIAEELTERGIAVVRFDFTGLGASGGDFSNTNFSSNVEDLVAAAQHMKTELEAPQILVGHSLGGAAVLVAAAKIAEVRAVATVGAPADPAHVTHIFQSSVETIEQEGVADVLLAGRPFQLRKQFIDDIRAQNLEPIIGHFKKALLVLHAPRDEVVGIENAAQIFQAARHPKSFLSLDDADHFLLRRSDADYAAGVIATWAQRYLTPDDAKESSPDSESGTVVVAETGAGKFTNVIVTGSGHTLNADEPVSVGGDDTGPTPYDLLLSALGTCKVMTMRMYAERKGYKLDRAEVRLSHSKIHATDCATCDTPSGKIDHIHAEITLTGDLTPEHRKAIFEIAEKCPVHRTITSEVVIQADLAADHPQTLP